MAAPRCSTAQEVVGFLPGGALLLNMHHEEFYAAGITCAEAVELGDD